MNIQFDAQDYSPLYEEEDLFRLFPSSTMLPKQYPCMCKEVTRLPDAGGVTRPILTFIYDFKPVPTDEERDAEYLNRAVRDNPEMRVEYEDQYEIKWDQGSQYSRLHFALGFAAGQHSTC